MKSDSTWFEEFRRQRLQNSARNPGLAAIMSFFVMGLGQVYAGHVDRGIVLLGAYMTGLMSFYSLYSEGLLYQALFPSLGANLIAILCYFCSVVFFLVWIYNIKDAYYLSLFSSFRDWLEVERVLLPVLKTNNGFLTPGASVTSLLEYDDPDDELDDKYEEVEVTPQKAAKQSKSSKEQRVEPQQKPRTVPPVSDEEVILVSDYNTLSFNRHSWKLYVGLLMIFVLVGIWLNNNYLTSVVEAEQATYFTLTADLPPEANSENILITGSGEMAQSIASLPSTPPAEDLLAPEVVRQIPEAAPSTKEVPSVAAAAVVVSPVPFMVGMQLFSNGEFVKAATEFKKDLVDFEPARSQWRNILNSFLRADMKLDYEQNLRRYLQEYPDDATAWFSLGKLLLDRNDLPAAAESLVRGLGQDDKNIRGNFLLASVYSDLKLYEDAIVYAKKAVDQVPLNVEFNRLLANSLAAADRHDEAERYFKRILSLKPGDPEASRMFAGLQADIRPDADTVVIQQGQTGSKILERESGLSTPDEIQTSGRVLFQASHSEPANATPEEAVFARAVPVDEPEVDKMVAEIPQQIEKPVPLPAAKVAAERQPAPTKTVDVAVFSTSSGISAAEAGIGENSSATDLKDAVAVERLATTSQKIDFAALREKGFYEYSRGNWEEALPHYLEYLKEREDGRIYDIVAIIFEKLNMHQAAFEASEQAYTLGVTEFPTTARLGRLAEKIGEFEKGQFFLYRAINMSPHRIDLRILFARCLSQSGKKTEALAELEKVVKGSSKPSYAVTRRLESEIARIKSEMN